MAGWWIYPDTPVSSTNKTDCHDITAEILLKVALNAITLTPNFLNGQLSYEVIFPLSQG
jgi:hypothetical protein